MIRLRFATPAAMLACSFGLLTAGGPASAHPHVFVANEVKAVFEAGALTALRYRWVFDEMYTASATEGLDKNNDGKLDAAELDELLKINMEGLKEFEYFTSATLGGQPVLFGDARDFGLDVVSVAEPPGPQMVLGPSSGTAEAPPPAPPRTVWGRISTWWSGLWGRTPTAASPPQTVQSQPAQSPAAATQAPPQASKVLALQFTLPLKTPLAADSLPGGAKGFQFQVHDPQSYIAFEPAGPDAIGLAPGAPAQCRHALVEPNMTEEQRKLAEAFARVGGMASGGFGKASAVICAAP